MNNKKIVLICILLIAIMAGILVALNIKKEENVELAGQENEQIEQEKEIVQEEQEDKIKIFSGKDRPIAFMIDNNKNAQPQASINKAYIVYEIIVEGNETRLMALFKGVEADEVGPIRSARHYFLNYAMENDAIYAHLGMSPQAQATFQEFGIQVLMDKHMILENQEHLLQNIGELHIKKHHIMLIQI